MNFSNLLMRDLSRNEPDDVEAVRERLRKKDDAALLAYGRAAAYMCTPSANRGEPPLDTFVLQLQEARAEWERRYKQSCQ